jgi:hypothetical protein
MVIVDDRSVLPLELNEVSDGISVEASNHRGFTPSSAKMVENPHGISCGAQHPRYSLHV